MGNRTLKYGGKSGILPKVRPVFKRFPIRPKTNEEIAEESKIEQGYADGVPLPSRKGFTFHRHPVERPVLTVEERIKRNISDREPSDIDESKLTESEVWKLKRDEIRRAHLKEAYEKEARRLERIEELRQIKEEKLQRAKNTTTYEETESTKLTLPTLDSYLKGPIMRQRTLEEQAIVEEQRTLNRKAQELEIKEKKANQILELYHAAANFITTEQELEQAIKNAFEVDVSKFESNQMVVENKLSGYFHAFSNVGTNENIVFDELYGQVNGQPGLETVKHTLDGEIEKLRREAQLKINEGHN